ncbi:cAMP-specific 3',5'-cyclic phosphodiesterase, isoforms N/G [Smittium mucronatum]|uniref:cAMP-specific 3',5'-cyclic phosphodiesterase, isoforms N/G n=1 Tax=Smittium mucronatum TaxID=133383 RepID=A0A1R0H6I6_9FUNG|nr:cAMP-specific 3',5'-cyclic phosphodiesterase, isoforms N/G [Smittium mucronatum]
MMKCDVILDSLSRRNLVTVLLHAVDIFNPVLPWPMSKKWSNLMMEESILQGDLEKDKGLQVSPSMDREKYDQINMSIEFSTIIIFPFFRSLCNLVPVKESILFELGKNISIWSEMKEERNKNKIQSDSTPSVPEISIVETSNSNETKLGSHIKLTDQTRRLSVAAGTIEISPGYYNQYRRHSDDTFENIIHRKIGLVFSKKLNRIQTRRRINKVCHLQPTNKIPKSRNQITFSANALSIRSSLMDLLKNESSDKDRPILRRAQSENLGCRCVYCKSSLTTSRCNNELESDLSTNEESLRDLRDLRDFSNNKIKNRSSLYNPGTEIHRSKSSKSNLSTNNSIIDDFKLPNGNISNFKF